MHCIHSTGSLVKDSIPGYKSQEQLQIVSRLIHDLPEGAIIVELGACAGRATWTLSKSAPKGSKIFAIDLWNGKKCFYGTGFNLDPSIENTKEVFLENVKGCSNVIALKGEAVNIPFDKEIDCLVLDCDNGRGRNNYTPIWNRWQKLLKKKSLIVGANYFPQSRPDEVAFAHTVESFSRGLRHEQGIWWCYKK